MKKTVCSILAIAVCGLLGAEAQGAPTARATSPAVPRATPAPRSRAKVSLAKIERPFTRKQLEPTRNKDASAELAAMLLRLADGTAKTKLEKRLAKKLGRTPTKLEAARRLASRWRKASSNDVRAAIGRVELDAKPKKKNALQMAVAKAKSHLFWQLRPTIPLPPEGIPAPSAYQLELTGIQTIAAHDADGSDELSTLAILATTAANNGFDLVSVLAPADGTITAPGAATTPVSAPIYDGPQKGMLVITAIVEDEGGNGAAARAEIEVMVDLAAAVAQTLDGSDRLGVLAAMVDYTVGLQNLGVDPQTSSRSITSTQVGGPDWFALWGTDPTATDGVSWKLAVPHKIASGQYELLLNVPSVLPEMATVHVGLDKVWVDSLDPVGPFKPSRMTFTGAVKGKAHTFVFEDVFSKSFVATLERKVLAGDVPLTFSGTLRLTIELPPNAPQTYVNAFAFCEQVDFQHPQCGQFVKNFTVDFAPGDGQLRSATYSTQSNKMVGLRTGRGVAANKLTSKGNEGRKGGFTITVIDVAE